MSSFEVMGREKYITRKRLQERVKVVFVVEVVVVVAAAAAAAAIFRFYERINSHSECLIINTPEYLLLGVYQLNISYLKPINIPVTIELLSLSSVTAAAVAELTLAVKS
jgi:hypothetical protein